MGMEGHDDASIRNRRGSMRWTIVLFDAVATNRRLVDTLRQPPGYLIVSDRSHPRSEADFHVTLATESARPQGWGRHVIVTTDINETTLRTAMRTGTAAVIPPDLTVEDARVVFAAVAAGYFPIPQRLAPILATRLEPPIPTLTQRDLIILEHLARGDPLRVIAQRLGCSERQTRRHLRTLWNTMGVPGRAQGLLAAARQGLLAP